jgi:hypothetical protein
VDRIAEVREAFPTPTERDSTLSKTQIALGFNFDDGGRLAELGSDLTEFLHTAEVWVFGRTPAEGRNTANTIRALVLTADSIPLIDIRDNARPVIDQLLKPERQAVVVNRQVAGDPRPVGPFVWTATIRCTTPTPRQPSMPDPNDYSAVLVMSGYGALKAGVPPRQRSYRQTARCSRRARCARRSRSCPTAPRHRGRCRADRRAGDRGRRAALARPPGHAG